MSSEHTPGEWTAERIDYSKGLDVSFEVTSGRRVIAGTYMREIKREAYLIAEDEANARRIVACVNACEGIPTEALESGAVRELLEALADVLRIAKAASIGVTGNGPRIARAEAAIAQARRGAA